MLNLCRFSYLLARSLIADDMIAKTHLERKISIQSLSEDSGERETWYKSEAAKDLLKREGVLHTDKRLFIKQAKRLTCKKVPTKESRRWFMHFFARSPNGLAVTGGRRDTSLRGNFRESLIKAQNAKHPNFAEEKTHWCPITCTWLHGELTTAAHIFPWRHGQKTMTRIFGTQAEHEMFSVQNGLIMSTMAEARMDKGLFVIVPFANDESEAEIKAWHESNPKRYKLWVLDTTDKMMEGKIPHTDPKITWPELDGREIQFRSDHRPRAQYLYYSYCVSMLRRSHHQGQHETILKDHLGRKFWGTPGAYLRWTYLLAFVEEIGAQDLLDGAEEGDENSEVDPTALVIANEQIRSTCRRRQDVSTIEWHKNPSISD